MITYKLNNTGDMAGKYIDGVATGEWANVQTNEAYLKWLAEGNTPEAADVITDAAPAQEG